MPRIPLVNEPKLRRNDFARTDKFNDLFRRCLRSDILPERDTHFRHFKHDEIKQSLYLTQRGWEDDRLFESDGTPFRHEKWIDDVFWKKLDNPRVCIVGSIGSGKSTLIDYYLRCYCPTGGKNSKDFERKLVLHFDARGVRDNHESYQQFYGRCQSLIRSACELGTPSFDIDAAIKRRPFPPNNVASWVQYALEEISSSRTPFGYIVVVLDNLDNSPIDVQRRLVRNVEHWVTSPSIKIWRVFLTLWPLTLAGLQHTDMAILRGVTQFKMGKVNEQDLFRNRVDALRNGYPISLEDSENDVAFRHYLDVMAPIVQNRLGNRLRLLSHGDLRSELLMLDGVLTSQVAYTAWKELLANPRTRRTFEYDLLSALVSGPYEQHHRTNVIRNVFTLGHNNLSPRDLLVAYHGLTAIQRGNGSVNSWYKTMMRFGYSVDNLQEVEENYREMNVFHQTPDAKTYSPNSYDFEVHHDVAESYIDLVTAPAYVDSVAQTTPIDDKWRNLMKPTRADLFSEFMPRVETSIEFIDYILENENAFKTMIDKTDASFANSFALPCFAHIAATRYLERLTALEESDSIPAVPEGWWTKQLNRLQDIVAATQSTLQF